MKLEIIHAWRFEPKRRFASSIWPLATKRDKNDKWVLHQIQRIQFPLKVTKLWTTRRLHFFCIEHSLVILIQARWSPSTKESNNGIMVQVHHLQYKIGISKLTVIEIRWGTGMFGTMLKSLRKVGCWISLEVAYLETWKKHLKRSTNNHARSSFAT